MTNIDAINNANSIYNAVKIQINNPKTNIPSIKTDSQNNGEFNSVNLVINEPTLDSAANKVYDYPEADSVVTYDFAKNMTSPIETPKIAGSYYTYTEAGIVPEPNFTTQDNEKSKLAFKGLSFKANDSVKKKEIEIIPSVDIKPNIDVTGVVSNLQSEDFDAQVLQMKKIIDDINTDSKIANEYVVTDVFSALIDIVKKDTTNFAAPNDKQENARNMIRENIEFLAQAEKDGKDLNSVKIPNDLTEEDIENAIKLSPLEEAERNKDYAMTTIAKLAKVYIDDMEQKTGNVIPLTDVPGISEIVDELRYNENPTIKMTAIGALRYISRPEYNEEISTILDMTAKTSGADVAKLAEFAKANLNQ